MMGTIARILDRMCRCIQPAAFYPLAKLREAIEKCQPSAGILGDFPFREEITSLKSIFRTELIFGATSATGGRVKFLSAV